MEHVAPLVEGEAVQVRAGATAPALEILQADLRGLPGALSSRRIASRSASAAPRRAPTRPASRQSGRRPGRSPGPGCRRSCAAARRSRPGSDQGVQVCLGRVVLAPPHQLFGQHPGSAKSPAIFAHTSRSSSGADMVTQCVQPVPTLVAAAPVGGRAAFRSVPCAACTG